MIDGCSPCRGRKSNFPIVVIGLVVVAVGAGWAIGKFRGGSAGPSPQQPAATTASARAEVLYQANCASCHGPDGHGDGPTAATLRPSPRDFAGRPWRFEVSKPSIRNVIVNGVPGTAMMAAATAFSPSDIDALVDHVYHMATTGPIVVNEPTPEEKLLRDANFVDLRGIEPPALTVVDSAGKKVKLTDLKGRLVLINFWGTGCEHCLKEMPSLRKVESELADRPFTVLHICADVDDAKEAQSVLDQTLPGMRALADETGLGLARFDVRLLPTVWLIDPSGKAIGRSSGAKDWRSPAMARLLGHWLPANTSPK